LVVAGAVGLVTVYSTLTRLLSFAAADQRALRAMGVTRVQRVAALVLFTVPAAVVAALLAIGLAVPSSALLPIGTLRRLEPDPGIRIDVTALAVGAAAVVLVVLVLAAITAIGVTRVRTERQTVSESSTGRAVSSWARASVPATIGVRMALDPGHGDRALPTRSTLAGGVVGVLGVVAALSFGSSLHHLTSTPSLYGGTAEILIGAPGGRTEWLALAHELLANEDVDEVATFIAVSLYVEGETVLALIVDPRRGDPVNTIVSGRAPQAGHELVMGRYAADRFAVGEGDMVSIARTDGSEADYEVVGIAAHPIGTEGSYREQVAILGDSVEGLATLDAIPGYAVAVTLRDGVDVAATAERFRATGHHVGTRATPPAVGNLEEVNVFPLVLAVCLAILAISSVLHALTTTARRRRHEIALLRSLGFTPRQLRTMLLTQASSIAVVSLAIGVPMGLVVGRTAWSAVTDNLGVLEQHQLPLLPLAWLLSLAVIGLIALWTARGLVAVHPAAQLRTGRQE
jgi:ABC-type lipoprotein release transport system permease subunit